MEALKKPTPEEIKMVMGAIAPLLRKYDSGYSFFMDMSDDSPVTEMAGITVGNLRAAARLREWIGNDGNISDDGHVHPSWRTYVTRQNSRVLGD